MKKFLIPIILIFCFEVYSNEVEVIELHESISLDQMVLQNQNNKEENIEEDIIDQNVNDTLVNSEDIAQAPIEENEFELSNLEEMIYLTIQKIKSDIVKNEFHKLLENINLDYEQKKNRDIFYSMSNIFMK